MDTKEEMIEEIDVMEDLSIDSKTEDETKNENTKIETEVSIPVIEEEILPSEINNDNEENKVEEEKNENDEEKVAKTSEESLNNEQEKQVEELPKKNKTPLIILLSVLLVLDIAALVIYIIGIEKVISFIKWFVLRY